MKIPPELEGLSKREIIRRYLILEQRVNIQQSEIEELKRRLLAYENAHTPPSQKRRYPKREKSNNKASAPKGHPGKTRKTPEPNRFKELSLDRCPHYQNLLGNPVKTQKKIIEDIPEPQPLIVTQFTILHYFCNHCNKEVIPTDPELPEEGRFGPNLQAEIALMKYEDRLPYEKITNNLNRKYNLNLVAATALDIVRRVADKLQAEYEAIKQEVKNSKQANADETGIKIKGVKHWAWTFITLVSVLFMIRPKRDQEVVKEALGRDYQGILTCDGFKSYPSCVKKIQRCWAHLLREAKWLAENYKGHAVIMYNWLCELFKKIKKVTVETLRRVREKLYDMYIREMKSWIGTAKFHKETKSFATTLENGLEDWFTCVLYPWIEPTNNKAERALREIVVQRKISSLWNQKGARMKEVIISILATWDLRGLNTFSMLRKTLSS